MVPRKPVGRSIAFAHVLPDFAKRNSISTIYFAATRSTMCGRASLLDRHPKSGVTYLYHPITEFLLLSVRGHPTLKSTTILIRRGVRAPPDEEV